eukprot:TRINITY_DN15995_c0_g1_i1.p1 TRINITY_DN15995_c0_g1~~TRINITY_DN15995_c0_g1_i1.p1  ORF type:complete len:390 (+),score=95.52 TRINITY_DN15995_c0_g1_i1:48-1217(+)
MSNNNNVSRNANPSPPASIMRFVIPFSLPIQFEKIFKNVTEETLQTLKTMSESRNNFITALDSDNPDEGLTASSYYIPCLMGLIQAAQEVPQDIIKSKLSISWTSSVAKNFHNYAFVCDHWHFEAVSALISYGMLHRSKACTLLNSVNSDDTFDLKSKEIAKHLCESAGIFNYINEVQMVKWNQKPFTEIPEKYTELYTALSCLSIAEAQQIALKKAIIKGTSNSLLAKLCKGIHNQYQHIDDLFINIDPNFAKNQLLAHFVFYIKTNAIIFKMLTFKYIGLNSYTNEKYGEAISYLKEAVRLSGLPLPKTGFKGDDMKQLFKEQQQYITALCDRHIYENNHCYYDIVPDIKTLPVPEGVVIMKPVKFEAPDPVPLSIYLNENKWCSVM